MDREKVWLGVQKYGITIGAAVSILSLFLTMFISGDTVRDQLTQRLEGVRHTHYFQEWRSCLGRLIRRVLH